VGLAQPTFSPDGRRVAVTSTYKISRWINATVVRVAPTDGLRPARRVPDVRLVDADAVSLAWTPDGRALAVPLPDQRGVDLVDVRTGHRPALLRGPADGVSFAPDGKAYTFNDAVWSPDGRRIAYLTSRDRHGPYTVHEGPDQPSNELHTADPDATP
jgi:dipeptidyl aminopeptidase/acylaminoacyl peptidase